MWAKKNISIENSFAKEAERLQNYEDSDVKSMNAVEIIYPSEHYLKSFHEALSVVANERIYIEMIEPPSLVEVSNFQNELILKNAPVYYAIQNEKVVGWCDVFPMSNPRQSHRGGLGMGLIPEFRGQGIGSRLLSAVLHHAKAYGLEKLELHVYTTNTAAVALYKKFGFEQEGLIQKYRKLDDQYFDCLLMSKFI
jgi:ribosomal protein S18 acetylase RimI-like enzyme